MRGFIVAVAAAAVLATGFVTPSVSAQPPSEWETVWAGDEIIGNKKIIKRKYNCKNPPCTTPQPADFSEDGGSLPGPRTDDRYEELQKGVYEEFDLWSVSPNSGKPAIYGQERASDWREVGTVFGRKPTLVGVWFKFKQDPKWDCALVVNTQYACTQGWGPWVFTGRAPDHVDLSSAITSEVTSAGGDGVLFCAESYRLTDRYFWPTLEHPKAYHTDGRPYVAPDDYLKDTDVAKTIWPKVDDSLNSNTDMYSNCYNQPNYTVPLPDEITPRKDANGKQIFATGRNDTNPGRYQATTYQTGKWITVKVVGSGERIARANLTQGRHVVLPSNLITGDTTVTPRSGIAGNLAHAPVVNYETQSNAVMRCGARETFTGMQGFNPQWPDNGSNSYYFASACPAGTGENIANPTPGGNPLDGGTPLPPVNERSELTGGDLAGFCAYSNTTPTLTDPDGRETLMGKKGGSAVDAFGKVSRVDYRGDRVDRWINGLGWASDRAVPGTLSYGTQWYLGGVSPKYPPIGAPRSAANTVSPSYLLSYTSAIPDVEKLNDPVLQPFTSIRWGSVSDYQDRQKNSPASITASYRESVWQDLNRFIYSSTAGFDRGLGVRFVEPSSVVKDSAGQPLESSFILQPRFFMRGQWIVSTRVIVGYINSGVGGYQPEPVYETRRVPTTATFTCTGQIAEMKAIGAALTSR